MNLISSTTQKSVQALASAEIYYQLQVKTLKACCWRPSSSFGDTILEFDMRNKSRDGVEAIHSAEAVEEARNLNRHPWPRMRTPRISEMASLSHITDKSRAMDQILTGLTCAGILWRIENHGITGRLKLILLIGKSLEEGRRVDTHQIKRLLNMVIGAKNLLSKLETRGCFTGRGFLNKIIRRMSANYIDDSAVIWANYDRKILDVACGSHPLVYVASHMST